MLRHLLILILGVTLFACNSSEVPDKVTHCEKTGKEFPKYYIVVSAENMCDGTVLTLKDEDGKLYETIMSIPNGNYNEHIKEGITIEVTIKDHFIMNGVTHLCTKSISELVINKKHE